MSYIANTAFEPRIVNNRFEDLVNIAGKFSDGTAMADCSAGFLCTRDELLDCEGFAGVKNENTWQMIAATDAATVDDVVYACNTYDSQLISDGAGNAYHAGHRTLGLGAPADRYCTFTRIDFDGQSVYRFGEGNVNGTLGTETFFTIADGLLAPAASAPTGAGSIYFELRGTGNFTEGTTQSFGYIDVVAKKVTA